MPERRGGERLSAADASNVVLDARDQVNAFLMAGLLGTAGFVSEDGAADLDRLRAFVAARLAERTGLARFSQRVRHRGRALVWEPAVPDLSWHVRSAEAVEGRRGLAELCARLMTTPIPTDRPLWELLVVPGASDNGPGIILRVHHAMADGVAGIRLVQLLFGAEPAAGSLSAPDLRPTATTRRRPDLRRRWHRLVTGVARVTAVLRATVPPTVLLGPIGPRRALAFVDVELPGLAAAARAAGATVNDALLAAVAVGAETALRADGQPVPRVLPASVPVALAARAGSGNAVGVMLVPLPTGDADPGIRLARIAATTRAAKAAARAQGTYELTRTRWGSRLFAWLARRQHFIALFVTNVHGPEQGLLIAGAPLERAWPVAPIQGNVRLGVSALSYAGRLGCAVHVDADALRADFLGTALAEELARIARLTGAAVEEGSA